MRRFIFILLSIISISSFVSEEYWKNMEDQLIPHIKHEEINYRLVSIKNILNDSTYAHIQFYSLSGAGSYGYVFSGKFTNGKKVAIKVHFEEDRYYRVCRDAFETQQAIIATGNSKYIVGLEQVDDFEFIFENDEIGYACVFLMEKGYVASETMFKNIKLIPSNTDNMVSFVVKTVEAFAALNFGANYYHADVKPQNLIWVKGNDGLIEPRIIDFDLSFKVNTENMKPGHALYTLTYRSPELLKYIPGINFATGQHEIFTNEYVLNKEYKEEAYAVGKSLSEIIKLNKHFINMDDNRILEIVITCNNMMTKEIDSRWSTKFAFEHLVKSSVNHVKGPNLTNSVINVIDINHASLPVIGVEPIKKSNQNLI